MSGLRNVLAAGVAIATLQGSSLIYQLISARALEPHFFASVRTIEALLSLSAVVVTLGLSSALIPRSARVDIGGARALLRYALTTVGYALAISLSGAAILASIVSGAERLQILAVIVLLPFLSARMIIYAACQAREANARLAAALVLWAPLALCVAALLCFRFGAVGWFQGRLLLEGAFLALSFSVWRALSSGTPPDRLSRFEQSTLTRGLLAAAVPASAAMLVRIASDHMPTLWASFVISRPEIVAGIAPSLLAVTIGSVGNAAVLAGRLPNMSRALAKHPSSAAHKSEFKKSVLLYVASTAGGVVGVLVILYYFERFTDVVGISTLMTLATLLIYCAKSIASLLGSVLLAIDRMRLALVVNAGALVALSCLMIAFGEEIRLDEMLGVIAITEIAAMIGYAIAVRVALKEREELR